MIDIGAFSIKFGFAGEASPRVVQPPVRILHGFDEVDSRYVFGDEYESFDCMLFAPRFGYSRGKILDKDIVENVLLRGICKCGDFDWAEYPFLISEQIGAERSFLEWILMHMFESYTTPGCCIVPQPTLALLSTGRTTGFVIELGYRSTQFSPIYEGCAFGVVVLLLVRVLTLDNFASPKTITTNMEPVV